MAPFPTAFDFDRQTLVSRPELWRIGEMIDLVDDTRLFRCVRCHEMVRICRRCDRGNRYCSRECSRLGRQDSLREARRRYARSDRGRAHHAARQKRYQARRFNAAPTFAPYSGFTSRCASGAVRQLPALKSAVCSSCGRGCSEFIRRDFLTMIRHSTSRTRKISTLVNDSEGDRRYSTTRRGS